MIRPPPRSPLFPYTPLSQSHVFYTARPRALLLLPAALRWAGAARRAAPPQEIQGCEGDAQFLRGHAGGGPSARAGVLRRGGAPPPRNRGGGLPPPIFFGGGPRGPFPPHPHGPTPPR